MQKYKLLAKLFYKSSNQIITKIFIFLFIVLSFAFFALMSIDSLNKSYKEYIFKSYIGDFGSVVFILQGNSKSNEQFLYKLKKLPYKSTLFSKSNMELKFNNITKRVNLIVWNKKEAVNIVFNHLIGNQFWIYNNKYKIYKTLKVLDTGFLNIEPILFLNPNSIQKLHIIKTFDRIAFNVNISQKDILKAKQEISKIAQKYNIEYKIKDVLSDNKVLLTNLKKLQVLENYLYAITLLLGFIVVLYTINIFINLKKRAIFVMRVYGLKSNDIALFFSLIGGFVILLSMIIAWIVFQIFKYYFSLLPLLDVNLWIYCIIVLIIFAVLYIYFKIKLKGFK